MISSQLSCPNDARLAQLRALASPDHNAIDYIEVLPSQRLLAVHCVAELPPLAGGPATAALGAGNVVIQGGVRVGPVNVVAAWRGDQVPAGTLTQPLGSDPTRVLVVATDSSGDFSTYRLLIVESSSALTLVPPTGFDPLLAAVDFSFKVDCPSDFDCAAAPACPPPTLQPVDIDYLAKDYTSFYQVLINRITTTMPQWQERNGADLGVALVELFSYVGDQLSYFQDAVATEAYLGTARQRVSVRRHARLLDYLMHDGLNARVFVCLLAAPGSDGTIVAAGTPITEDDAVVGPGENPLEQAVALGAAVFQTLHDVVVHESQNTLEFHTWGDPACCLPRGATTATLVGDPATLALQSGDVLIFQERLGPVSGAPGDARVEQRCAVRLIGDPVAATDPLPQALGKATSPLAVANITWHDDDALPFPLCLHEFTGTLASYARGNVVLADHGLSVSDPALAVPELGPFAPVIGRPDVTQAAPYDDKAARARAGAAPGPLSAAAVLATDVRTALPAITEQGEELVWTPARDLIESGAFDAQFVAETDNAGQATLRFGDGTLGRAPRPGEQYQASYRIGNGSAGNVGPDTLTRVRGVNGVSTATNPLPGSGGIDPESIELVKLYAPAAFRTQERAVTEDDYVTVCERFPGVQSAAATRRFTGSWDTMFLTVERSGGLAVDAAFKSDLAAFLDGFRLAGGDVEIESPQWVPLEIELRICVAAGYVAADVETDLFDRFSANVRANGSLGFFAPENWTFGTPVYLSPLIAAAMEVPGVADVNPVAFQRWGRAPEGELQNGLIKLANLEIAQLANDPSRPESGLLVLDMEGGL